MYPYRHAPDVEINGRVVQSLITHARRDQVLDSLKKHDLDEIDPEK